MLFKSLHTLAGQCPAILITVARDGADKLRVNVMPKAPTSDAGKTDVKEGALFTPISLSGTPDELDSGFAEALAGYTETRRDLRSAVEDARTTMQAATKAKKPSASPARTAPAPKTPPPSAGRGASQPRLAPHPPPLPRSRRSTTRRPRPAILSKASAAPICSASPPPTPPPLPTPRPRKNPQPDNPSNR